jgi:hypothetical protein
MHSVVLQTDTCPAILYHNTLGFRPWGTPSVRFTTVEIRTSKSSTHHRYPNSAYTSRPRPPHLPRLSSNHSLTHPFSPILVVHLLHIPICPSPRLRTMILTTVHQYAQTSSTASPRACTHPAHAYTHTYPTCAETRRALENATLGIHLRNTSLHASPPTQSCDCALPAAFARARVGNRGRSVGMALLAGIPHRTAPHRTAPQPPCQRVLWKTGYLRPGVAV